jgi:signal transduction histidine kinase
MVASLYFVNTIFVLLVTILGLWMGFWVFFADRRGKINQTFLLMTLSVVFWVIFAYFCNSLNLAGIGRVWAKLGYGMAALFFIPFYFFANQFPDKFPEPEKKKKMLFLDVFVVIVSFSLFLFSVFSDFLVREIKVTEWGVLPIMGNGKFIYFWVIFFLTLFIVVWLLSKYFKSTTEKKLKMQYLLIGLFIFIVANIIFNVILPFWQGIPQYYQFGNYSAIVFLGFTAYAIIKRKLFGIRVVLTEILVAGIALLLFVQILASGSIFEYIWRGGLFLLFLLLGYLLVRSIVREIKLREELETAYENLKKLDRAKSEFISIASHQLRTPLTAIKGYISMILEGSYGRVSDRAKRPIENVYKSAERLIRLVNDLLSMSRIEAGRLEMKLERASLQEIISSTVKELKQEAKNKRIYLKFETPQKPLPKIIIDKDKIRQVFLNVIDNAIRYTTKGGVRVKAEILEDKIQIIISDTGEGMNQEEIADLFESFSRGKAGSRLWSGGAGLGLYVAKKFIEMHKGKIWAESEGRGRGSTFYIELPINMTPIYE